MMRTDRISKGGNSEEKSKVLRSKCSFPSISINTFTMCKMIEDIKINSPKGEKGT